jgi:hypothetical protein
MIDVVNLIPRYSDLVGCTRIDSPSIVSAMLGSPPANKGEEVPVSEEVRRFGEV